MEPLDALLRLLAVPLGITLVACGLARRLAPGRARVHDVVSGLALGGAYPLALYLVGIRPDFPLAPHQDAWSWVAWSAPAGALLGAASVASRLSESSAAFVRFAFGTGAAWLVLRPLTPHTLSQTEALVRGGAWGACAALLAAALVRAARAGGRARLALPTLAALGGAFVLLSWGGRSMTMAAGALALAGGVGGAALLAPWCGSPALPEAAAPAVATTFVGLLAGAHGYLNYGDHERFPLACALLLLAASLCVLVPRWRWGLALALALVGVAALLGIRFGEGWAPD